MEQEFVQRVRETSSLRQEEAVKKFRQKMYADAATGDPETQARYEHFLATRRENYRRKKQAEAEVSQAT